jgi:outer membrane protein assembly factor BamA
MQSRLVALAAKEYRALVHLAVGDVFDRSKMLAGINAIRALLHERGVTKDVEPKMDLDPAKGKVAVELVIR